MTEQQAKDSLKKQAILQICLPDSRHKPRSKFDEAVPNEVHQADLHFLPHDRVRSKTFHYALTVVDVANRYKEAKPLTSKTAAEVGDGLAKINKRSPLRWPKLLLVDPGREFMGSVSQLLVKHFVKVRCSRVDIHRDQGIVERFNQTLTERLFGHQYAQEMRLPSGERSSEWEKRLPSVVAALNGEVTRLTAKKLSDAIKAKTLTQKLSSVVPGRPLGLKEQKVPSGVGFRYLYQPGELEDGRLRATDPVWSLEVYRLRRLVTKPESPWGWSGGAMVLGKLPGPGRPTILITVGQGPIALAVGAGGDGLDIFTLPYPFSPLSPSRWWTARYRLKHCLKGLINLKQPTESPCCTTCRVTMSHSEALFEKSCLWCRPTHSYHLRR